MSGLDALLLEDADHAAACGKMLRAIDKYTTLPAQRAKAAKLARHAPCGAHILAALRRVRHREGDLDPFLVGNLQHWGLVLVALLDPASRVALLRDLMDGDYALPYRDKQLTLLHATVQAALPFAAGDEEFAERAGRLAVFEAARRGASESVAWARALGLPFAEEQDWRVMLYVPHASNRGLAVTPPTMLIDLCPHPDFSWSVNLEDDRNRHYSERPHGVAQDDIGLPAIRRLADLPAWIRALPDGVSFDTARAKIFCGRHRAAAKKIAAWLAGA